jgi:glycosyltransferase involved in cell wall biosynthesis
LEIINEYKNNYKDLIKVIDQKNGGLSSARNSGTKYAEGKYLAFIDSDDFIELDMYDKMIDIAEKDCCDVVLCDIEFYWGNKEDKNFVMKGLRNNNEEIKNRALLSPLFAWNKIYNKEYFDKYNLEFEEGIWYEDLEVTTFLLANATNIGYLNETMVHYRQREDSIMGTTNIRVKEIYHVLERVYRRFEGNGLLDKYFDEIEYLFIEDLLLYGQYRLLRLDDFKQAHKESKIFINKYFPNYSNNKYLKSLNFKERFFIKTNNYFTCGLYRKYLVK